MKAIVYTKYGPPDVLELKEVEKPAPKDNEVLIKVYATTVTRGDSRMRSFTVPFWQWLPARIYLGIRKPKRAILGMSLAGVIESVGKNVIKFKKGDAVYASTFGVNFGGYAEYITSSSQCKILLKKKGIYLNVHGSSGHNGEMIEEYLFLNELIKDGKLKPFIDRVYSMEQIVEAHRYVDKGHKKGNIAITVGHKI